MHDCADGSSHLTWVFGLEYIAPHIDPVSTTPHGVGHELESLTLRYLLAASNH
jgi:hypothetical protein